MLTTASQQGAEHMNSLQSYSRIVFFTGAGMSAESGVPNYDDFLQFLRQMEESKDSMSLT
jgi:NAD-dependent SIR2 family protein deacetylase